MLEMKTNYFRLLGSLPQLLERQQTLFAIFTNYYGTIRIVHYCDYWKASKTKLIQIALPNLHV